MGHLRRTATDPFDDTTLHTLQDLVDGLTWAEAGDEALLRRVVKPAETALTGLPSVTIAPSAARAVATGAPVYAPGVIDSERSVREAATDATESADSTVPEEAGGAPLVACFTPDESAVCLGRLVGDPAAESGTVVAIERVLV